MATEATVLAALLATLTTAASPQPAHSIDELGRMTSKPSDYIEVGLSRRFAEVTRLDPGADIVHWRLTVRAVAVTGGGARDLLTRARAALDGRMFAVGAETTTPVLFETGAPVGPDDSWWSGLDVWTFAI